MVIPCILPWDMLGVLQTGKDMPTDSHDWQLAQRMNCPTMDSYSNKSVVLGLSLRGLFDPLQDCRYNSSLASTLSSGQPSLSEHMIINLQYCATLRVVAMDVSPVRLLVPHGVALMIRSLSCTPHP